MTEQRDQSNVVAPAYTRRWRLSKRLGLMRENQILRDNEITGRGFVAGLVVLVVCLTLGIGAIASAFSSHACAVFGSEYHRPTHWRMFYGCYVTLANGRSLPSGQVRVTELVK